VRLDCDDQAADGHDAPGATVRKSNALELVTAWLRARKNPSVCTPTRPPSSRARTGDPELPPSVVQSWKSLDPRASVTSPAGTRFTPSDAPKSNPTKYGLRGSSAGYPIVATGVPASAAVARGTNGDGAGSTGSMRNSARSRSGWRARTSTIATAF